MSDYLSALLLGLVEGLTEFLPVSSTGHLILFGDVIGFKGPLAETFEIFIQLGAILAVVVLYFGRFKGLLDFSTSSGGIGDTGFKGLTGLYKLALGCAPAFILGAFLHGFIKSRLFYPIPVAVALIVGGLVLLLIERRNQTPSIFSVDTLSARNCLIIGLFQCAALWPGISRSAATIAGGLVLGLERKVAAEFSFFLAVPIMCAAVAFDLYKNTFAFGPHELKIFACGFVVAFISAVLAIRVFIGILSRFSLTPFAIYRILLGAVVLLSLKVPI